MVVSERSSNFGATVGNSSGPVSKVYIHMTIHMKAIFTVHSIIRTIVIVIQRNQSDSIAFLLWLLLPLKYTHIHTAWGEKNKSSHIIVADE